MQVRLERVEQLVPAQQSRSTTGQPVHTFLTPQPLHAGEIVAVDVALGPSAILFRAGESLRLVVAGRWLSPRNPLEVRLGVEGRSVFVPQIPEP